MATPQLTFLFMGVLALLATVGSFMRFDDDGTRVVMGITASVLWAVFGYSAYEVEVTTACCRASREVTPLVYLGFASALFLFLVFLREALRQVQEAMPGS